MENFKLNITNTSFKFRIHFNKFIINSIAFQYIYTFFYSDYNATTIYYIFNGFNI